MGLALTLFYEEKKFGSNFMKTVALSFTGPNVIKLFMAAIYECS